MEKRLEEQIKIVAGKFLEIIKDKEVQVISHFDTDGITSATIIIKTLKRLDLRFSVKIVKSLEEEFILNLPKKKMTLFLDLASGSLNHIKKAGLENVFIIDHHEIVGEIPPEINIVNPELHAKQKMSASCVTYLFCRQISQENKEFAKLAILGMIGDMLEKEVDTLNNDILNDGEIKRKRGLLIYPSTRPLNRVLEYSSNPYIPGVTGNIKGVFELLREVKLKPERGKYKSLIELTDKEMKRLVTAIMLKKPKTQNGDIIGDIFLIKLYNKLEDARELSAMINACSRIGRPDLAIQFLMEIPKMKKQAESTYIKYKQHLISGLKTASEIEKIVGKGYVIINAKDQIKDTMIGTIASILSRSSLYEEGTIIIGLANYEDKIKVSARRVGINGKNAREVLTGIVEQLGGEVGGHNGAAGCIISRQNEEEFINLLKKNLEIEMVKV